MFKEIRQLIEDVLRILSITRDEYCIDIDLLGYDKFDKYHWEIKITILNVKTFSFMLCELNHLREKYPQIIDMEYTDEIDEYKTLTIQISEK